MAQTTTDTRAGHGPGEQTDGPALSSGLKGRHVTMISIAGVIGAGLFVGSSSAIAAAGPAVLISYALAGLLVVLVMRMLGEMATAQPDTGSFSTYADRSLGRWAGFSVGWLYWWFWVLVIPVEATAAAAILHSWVPAVPLWGFALAITGALTATNLFSVANYGEFEFWFALVKVVAIVAFIVVGVLAITGVLPGTRTSGLEHLTAHGGFMPKGLGAVLAAMLITMFSFMGTEIVTIAAAESPDPERGIRKAVNSVIWRISLFYLGSIFVVTALVAWDDPRLAKVGSYQAALEAVGVPGAKLLVDVVVLTAVASCLNSALYTASRMAFSLSRRGDAPRAWGRVSERQVPRAAILASTAVGFLAVIANYVVPEKVFGFLLASTGAVALVIYLVIALSQLTMRRRLDAEGHRPEVRMWAFPVLTFATIAFIVAVLGLMALQRDYWDELGLTALITVGTVIAGVLVGRRHRTARNDGSDRVSASA